MNEKLLEKILDKLLFSESAENKTTTNKESAFIWEYVLLRCRNAWVHFWKLESIKDNVFYTLSESRRIYYWKIKDLKWISLSELAMYWLHNDSKLCATIPLIEITEIEWAEIIPINKDIISEFKNKEIYIP